MRLAPAAVFAALALAAPARADVLIDNVAGETLDAQGAVQTFNGVLVGDDGRIEQLFRRGDKRPRNVDYIADGGGKVLLPGMIDSHVHVMAVGMAQLTLDLSETKSLAEAQAKIAAYAAAHPDRPWIIGRGWNHETWALGRFPTAAELDAAASDRPVWLMRADGHAGWANSRALAAGGVTAATKEPPGGRIERAGPGKPAAGVLVDAAMALVEKAVPAPRPEDRDMALIEAQQFLLARGITTVADMGTTIEDWQAFRRAGDMGRLRLRIVSYAAGTQAMELIGGPGPSPWLYQDRLKLNGVKLYLDGALGSRGAALKAAYADAPGNKGLPQLNDTQLRNLMSRAAIDTFQIAIHAIGDAANAMALDAIGELAGTYKGDRRWRIEHAQHVDPADFARFGQYGVIASMQPVHQQSDRAMTEARLGPARLAGAYAWKSLSSAGAGAGARLAFGSDAPVELPEPFVGMAVAFTRQDAAGKPFGGWQPQERLTREAALAGYTTGGAWALFAEGRLGRVAPGFRGDFVLVDRDPMLATPEELRATKVLQTWVNGEMVWKAK